MVQLAVTFVTKMGPKCFNINILNEEILKTCYQLKWQKFNLYKALGNYQDSEPVFAVNVEYDYENRNFYWETNSGRKKVNSKFWRKIPIAGHLDLGSFIFYHETKLSYLAFRVYFRRSNFFVVTESLNFVYHTSTT